MKTISKDIFTKVDTRKGRKIYFGSKIRCSWCGIIVYGNMFLPIVFVAIGKNVKLLQLVNHRSFSSSSTSNFA
jgi:hypothetical protein